MTKVTKVERKAHDTGTPARPANDNWDVHFSDGEVVEVANYGDGPVALGLNTPHKSVAEQAVRDFMGW